MGVPQERRLTELGTDLGLSREKVRRIKNRAIAKLRPRREIGFRVTPGDLEAWRFRDEYWLARANLTRCSTSKALRKAQAFANFCPSRPALIRCRSFSREEIAALAAPSSMVGGLANDPQILGGCGPPH